MKVWEALKEALIMSSSGAVTLVCIKLTEKYYGDLMEAILKREIRGGLPDHHALYLLSGVLLSRKDKLKTLGLGIAGGAAIATLWDIFVVGPWFIPGAYKRGLKGGKIGRKSLFTKKENYSVLLKRYSHYRHHSW